MRFRHLLPLAVLAGAGAFAVSIPAAAADVHLVAGGSMTTSSRWTHVAFVDVAGSTRNWRGIHWQPVATVGWINGRNTHLDDLNHDVFVGGAGVRLVDWWRGAFFSFQLGAAAGRTDAISSAGQFISSLGWQGEHYVVMVRHISNGRIYGGKNLGETMLMAGVRF